jgi:hypothetical protein
VERTIQNIIYLAYSILTLLIYDQVAESQMVTPEEDRD